MSIFQPSPTEKDNKQPLPVGRQEFMDWSDRIIATAGQFADTDSMRYALASQIIHLPHDVAFKSDEYFVNALRKAAANQVASAIFQEIKQKQIDAAAKAAAESSTSSDEPQKQQI